MNLEIVDDSKPTTYDFSFRKQHTHKKRTEILSNTSGSFSLLRQKSDKFENCYEYIFNYQNFYSKENKDPLLFDPIKWLFNIKLNGAGISSKEDLKIQWDKYKNKYRSKENIIHFKALESLYFKSLFGLEYMFFSNSPFLIFFINYYDIDIDKDKIIRGPDFLFMPMSIPVNTWYKCTKIDDEKLYFSGWVTLDEDKLEALISQKQFKDHAKSYHFSKDFSIESNIEVCINIKNTTLNNATFEMHINGEKGSLKEDMYYEIKSNIPSGSGAKYVIGRPVIIDNW